jgi:hypothetical protein
LYFTESTKVTDDTLKIIGGLKQLQWLQIASSQVTGSGLQHLAGCVKLKSLSLKSKKLNNAELSQLEKLAKLPLVSLSIGGWQANDEGLEHVGKLEALESLTLHPGQTAAGESLVTGRI